jgi:hypothetical protein
VVCKLKKHIVALLSVLLIISIGFNAYQYSRLLKERQKAYDLAGYHMSNAEATFSNGLVGLTQQNLEDYIGNLENINNMIEYIQMAETYYNAATHCVSQFQLADTSAGFSQSEWLISNGYLKDIRDYRQYLISRQSGNYEHIDQITTDVADLLTISKWLEKRYNNGDFSVYDDDDFYKEVYDNLKSEIKYEFFNNFTIHHE